MAVEDEIITEREGGIAPPKALSGSPQKNFLDAKSSGGLTKEKIQQANQFASSIGTTFDEDKGYSREAFIQGQKTPYERHSESRESRISLPITTGETSADFQARTGATVPQGRETFSEAQSRGREQRMAFRAPFNAPFTTDQQGNRTAIQQGVGEEGQRFTLRPPSDVRNILTNGPQSQRDVTRIKRFSGTSAGKNLELDFGDWNSRYMKFRRTYLGPEEDERQRDMVFKERPIEAPANDSYDPVGDAQPVVDDSLDYEDTDTTMAFNDFQDYTADILT